MLQLAISILVQVKHDLPDALDTVKEFAVLNGGEGVGCTRQRSGEDV